MADTTSETPKALIGLAWFIGLALLFGLLIERQGPTEPGHLVPTVITMLSIIYAVVQGCAWIYSKSAARPMNPWAGLIGASVVVGLFGLGTLG
jgi:hypothetical protein